MKNSNRNRLLVALALMATCAIGSSAETEGNDSKRASASPAGSKVRANLSQSEQNRLLSKRLRGGDTNGTFDSFASMLYAIYDVAIHTNDEKINAVVLETAFVESYSPTLREILDSIAWQTSSSWKYEAKTGDWAFSKSEVPLPFALSKAEKWTESKRTTYVSYHPDTFPVGMDVYCWGSHSAPEGANKEEFGIQVRDEAALWFAAHFKKDVALKEMRAMTVSGDEALYFEGPTQRPDITWRQWVLVHGGRAFVIVSTLPDSEKQLLSDVQTMVNSFRASRVKP